MMLEPDKTGVTVRIDRESAEIVDEYMRTEGAKSLNKAVSNIIKEWHSYMKECHLN